MDLYILSKPCVLDGEVARFLNDENSSWRKTVNATSPEEVVEFAGRVCYMSFGDRQSPRDNSKYIKNLIFQGHESVLEHASWTFLVTGVTRAFSHQLVRHRAGFSYSQLSQQYHDEGDATFIPPIGVVEGSVLYDEWKKRVEDDRASYSHMITALLHGRPESELDKEELRLIRNTARSVLPNCIETKIVFSANARAIRHFLKLRGGIVGDLEMRYFSKKLLSLMTAEAPSIFNDFSVSVRESDQHPIVLLGALT